MAWNQQLLDEADADERDWQASSNAPTTRTRAVTFPTGVRRTTTTAAAAAAAATTREATDDDEVLPWRMNATLKAASTADHCPMPPQAAFGAAASARAPASVGSGHRRAGLL